MAVPTTPPTATSMAPYPWNGVDATYASRASPSLHLGRHGDTSAVVLIFRDLKLPSGGSVQSAALSFARLPPDLGTGRELVISLELGNSFGQL